MSYILDALRKADAERERDPARGIHAQPMAQLPAASRRLPPALGAALAAVLVVAGGAAYVLRERSAPAPLPAPVAVAPVPAPVLAPVPAAPPAAAPVADSVQPAPPPMPAPQPVKVAAVKAAPAAPVAKTTKTADAAKPADANKGAATTQVAAAAPTAPASQPAEATAQQPAAKPLDAAKASPSATAERIYAQAELPADIQHALPKLAISGGVYSENAAQRMLVVGGQVVGEGAELAPGVLLEQIRSRSAVLRFKGWRYSVGF
ncbi:general secretion pathway protein GspB [Ramlibacter sp. G-1-2-2]|uniref:General secretion pathway protein GspB n=1 Tax=Ramlibacter agri TaxID=2728837 RepID=A0A848H984_9BURK|nr:general secretion pathway protein GspB [Ramlibacter agri]NML45980.1 general secretion pathway protein GspB [Ramlibacter agri]